MPVSTTDTFSSTLSEVCFLLEVFTLSTLIVIAPSSVNLNAFPSKLMSTCLMRFLSDVMYSGMVGL